MEGGPDLSSRDGCLRLGQPCRSSRPVTIGGMFRRKSSTSDSGASPKPEEKQGFFKRLRAKLNRGNSWLTYDLADLFRGRKIDAQILEELESRLLMADVGVEATEHILSGLQKRVARNELQDVAALISALRDSIV